MAWLAHSRTLRLTQLCLIVRVQQCADWLFQQYKETPTKHPQIMLLDVGSQRWSRQRLESILQKTFNSESSFILSEWMEWASYAFNWRPVFDDVDLLQTLLNMTVKDDPSDTIDAHDLLADDQVRAFPSFIVLDGIGCVDLNAKTPANSPIASVTSVSRLLHKWSHIHGTVSFVTNHLNESNRPTDFDNIDNLVVDEREYLSPALGETWARQCTHRVVVLDDEVIVFKSSTLPFTRVQHTCD